jgi:hypothetical protein
MLKRLAFVLMIAVAAICFYLLISGSSYCERELAFGLPLGNALASIGLCTLAGSAFCLSPMRTFRRRISGAILLGAVLWLPISIALAGNLALNFSGFRGTIWLVISFATSIAVLVSLLLVIALALLGKSDTA